MHVWNFGYVYDLNRKIRLYICPYHQAFRSYLHTIKINSPHSTAPMSLLRWATCVLYRDTILSSILRSIIAITIPSLLVVLFSGLSSKEILQIQKFLWSLSCSNYHDDFQWWVLSYFTWLMVCCNSMSNLHYYVYLCWDNDVDLDWQQ